MKNKKKLLSRPVSIKTEKNYRIRFRDEDQLELVKDAARQQGIPFNTFVIDVCEKAARFLLENNPRDGAKVLTNAVNASLTER
jgi:uncharacterized protein (DUF1778 family)